MKMESVVNIFSDVAKINYIKNNKGIKKITENRYSLFF